MRNRLLHILDPKLFKKGFKSVVKQIKNDVREALKSEHEFARFLSTSLDENQPGKPTTQKVMQPSAVNKDDLQRFKAEINKL